MKTWMLWHGGYNYASGGIEDVEAFDSLAEARNAFDSRYNDYDPFYPCVDESSSAWVFFSDPADNVGDLYPDRVLEFGPRGGVVMYDA